MTESSRGDLLWHNKTSVEVLQSLESSESGLSKDEVKRRQDVYGWNTLPEKPPPSILIIFLRQFEGPLIAVLLGSALIVFFLGDTVDALVILAVLVTNAIVGAFQEGRAENQLSALKKFTETNAEVRRSGREVVIPDKEVVPGDIILLKEGDKIPADARLISDNELLIDEAALTGESEPVRKSASALYEPLTPVSDQKNMIFRGTYAISGIGSAVVIATGTSTVIGKLAEKLSVLEAEVPLKTSIRRLTKGIMIALAIIVIALFFLGLSAGYSSVYMFKTVVAIAVSFVPEGLPVVVTLILATGVWRMSKKNALVKRLQAVEALGQAKIIAVDKTGTVTKNQMMVTGLYTDGNFFDVLGNGYDPTGTFQDREKKEAIEPLNHPALLLMGKIATFNANASIAYLEEEKEWKRLKGEPTEAALLTFGHKLGFTKEFLERENPKCFEVPFNSRLKYHATINESKEGHLFSIVSAPEIALQKSTTLYERGTIRKMTPEDSERITKAFHKLSDEGLRVLGLAFSNTSGKSITPEHLPSLTFVGLVGLTDVIREEVYDAVASAHRAGVKVVMITGDYRITAGAIARKIGIPVHDGSILSGQEIEEMDERELSAKLDKVTVFARVSPEHKLKIIEAYRRRGDIIAMTGDGVNDALSLAAADLGVAMGKMGTEVAKEAADIVLLDDNFGSIVSAIEEGRNIYRSIRKVVLYLLSTGAGEVLAISFAMLMGYPIPFTPSQIIWLNLVTDGFLVVALGMEPKDPGVLTDHFKKSGKWIVSRLMLFRIVFLGTAMAGITMILFIHYLSVDPLKASTVALSVLAVIQWFNAWNCRSSRASIFSIRPFSNMYLWYATLIVVLLQLAVVYVPFMQTVFKTVPLGSRDWLLVILLALSILLVEELRKLVVKVMKK